MAVGSQGASPPFDDVINQSIIAHHSLVIPSPSVGRRHRWAREVPRRCRALEDLLFFHMAWEQWTLHVSFLVYFLINRLITELLAIYSSLICFFSHLRNILRTF